jgi:hypothetical protein
MLAGEQVDHPVASGTLFSAANSMMVRQVVESGGSAAS